MKPKALVFGEVLWDVYPNRKYIGGAPFNFAVHFALSGGESYLVSAVGDDGLGRETLKTVSAYGVNTDCIATVSDFPTGRCDVTLDGEGHPKYRLGEHTAFDRIPFPEKIPVDGWNLLCFGTLSLREAFNHNTLRELLEKCRFRNVLVDVNLRAPHYTKETVILALNAATVLKVSDEELPTLLDLLSLPSTDTEAGLRLLHGRFPQIHLFVLTMGAKGAVAFLPSDETRVFCPAVPTDAVSTVGAGDSFGAAFAYSYLTDGDLLSSLQAASLRAAETVSREGAVPPLSELSLKE